MLYSIHEPAEVFDEGAYPRSVPEMYSELKRLASRKLKGENLRVTMHTTRARP